MAASDPVCGRRVVAVFARYPEPGSVKTRLAATVGSLGSCLVYAAFLRDLRARLAAVPDWQLVWAVHPPGSPLEQVVGPELCRVEQTGSTLGERMDRCVRELFDRGAARVLLLGADAPHLGLETLREAFDCLDTCDLVLVPTRDGGYCSVGLGYHRDLFSEIEMGRPDVFEKTFGKAKELGLRVRLLPETFDVDEARDLEELARGIREGRFELPETRAVLGKLGWHV